MRRDVVLAQLSAIVYHTQYAHPTDSARAVLCEPASSMLQSNSRPPHSFAAQPGVFVVSHECSAMARLSGWLIRASRQPCKTPSPQPIPSLRRITCGALHETLARVSMSSMGPVEHRGARERLLRRTVDCASKRSLRQRFTAMRLTAALRPLLFVSTAMSSSIHGADVAQSSRRCRIPHPATEAQGARNTSMSPVTKRGCLSNRQFRVSGFRVHGDPADASCHSHNTSMLFGRLGRIDAEYRPRGLQYTEA